MKRLLAVLLLLGMSLLSACGAGAVTPTTAMPAGVVTIGADPEIGAIREYLLEKVGALRSSTAALKASSDRYWTLVNGASSNYRTLWSGENTAAASVITEAKGKWLEASPLYEQVEGIVAGVPHLALYSSILDSGSSADEGGDNVAPIDVTLPDNRVLTRPGNLFSLTERTLWASDPAFVVPVPGVKGAGVPDAAVLKGAADALDSYANELYRAAQDWTPSVPDAFTALVVMVPTMSELFDSWKSSYFVVGDAATSGDYVAVSRLSDIEDILSGLIVIHNGLSSRISAADPAADHQIGNGLTDLQEFVAGIHQKEQAGTRFTPEQADLLGAEAQNRATAISGQITQVMAKLNVAVETGTGVCTGLGAVTPTPEGTK